MTIKKFEQEKKRYQGIWFKKKNAIAPKVAKMVGSRVWKCDLW